MFPIVHPGVTRMRNREQIGCFTAANQSKRGHADRSALYLIVEECHIIFVSTQCQCIKQRIVMIGCGYASRDVT